MFRRASPRIAVVLGYVLVALAFTWPLPLHLATAFTGDPDGDTGVYIWNQWVFQHEALVEHRNPLTTEHVLSLTQTVDLSQHNYTAFLNVLALPMIPWLGIVRSFNLVFLTITVLTALATYALARRVTAASRAEAWLAGLLFAWSPVLVARSTAHFSLVAAAPLPAFLLCLIKADRSRALRDAALAGLCMAWAAFCDVYYAMYCLVIAGGYLLAQVIHVRRADVPAPAPWRWILDVLIVLVGGLVAGLLFGRGGSFELFGISVSIRGLYTPMLVLTVLVLARVLLALRSHIVLSNWTPSPAVVRGLIVAVLACAGPLTPVLYGLGQRMIDGRLVSPPIMWRSSPPGLDLLRLIEPNPNHPVVRLFHDAQTAEPRVFAENMSALSLVALLVIALAAWRARYRPGAGWIWLTAGFAALALGPFVHVAGINTYIPGPWAVLRYVPIIGWARTPTRLAVVAALGLAVLFAGAVAALGQRYPRHRRFVIGVIGAALVFELLPAPRTLYSAAIPSIYQIIADDPRPVRIVELPFGVRDGLSGVGDFSSRSLYYQTQHEKRLIGGYLSRISQKRVKEMRAQPTLDALITLSEGRTLTPEHLQRIHDRGARFIKRANVGYVVINYDRSPQALVDFAMDAWELEEIARDGSIVLYRPTTGLAESR